MSTREWVLVRRIATFIIIVAIFPLGALTYRLYLSPEATSQLLPTPTPQLFTLVPLPTQTPAPTSAKPTSVILVLPNGWTEYQVADQGFAIALPGGWQRLPVKQPELDAALQVIRQQNTELAAALGSRGEELFSSGVKLWAFDPDPNSLGSKFATNVTITHQTLRNEISFDSYIVVNLNQINRLASRSGTVSHQRVTLGDLPAEQVNYDLALDANDGTTVASSIAQYLLLYKTESYVITFSTRAEEMDNYRPTFEQSAGTFRVFER